MTVKLIVAGRREGIQGMKKIIVGQEGTEGCENVMGEMKSG